MILVQGVVVDGVFVIGASRKGVEVVKRMRILNDGVVALRLRLDDVVCCNQRIHVTADVYTMKHYGSFEYVSREIFVRRLYAIGRKKLWFTVLKYLTQRDVKTRNAEC